MRKISFIFILLISLPALVVAQRFLIFPAKAHWQLTADATSTTFTLSTDDADALNNLRLAYGGSLRILIYAPATLTNPTPAYETVLINSAPSSGVFTVSAMTNYASYTTARGASVTPTVYQDAELEEYNIGAWTESNCTAIKYTESYSGVQALRIEATAASGYVYNNYDVAADENYHFSCMYKTFSGDSFKVVIYDVTNSANILVSGSLTSTTWKRFSADIKIPTSCTEIQVQLYAVNSGDVVFVDQVSFVQSAVDNGGFEVTGSELVTNGTFDTDVSGWSGFQGGNAVATLTWDNTDIGGNTAHAKVENTGTGFGDITIIQQNIGTSADKYYIITADLRVPSANVSKHILFGFGYESVYYNTTLSSDTWTSVSWIYKVTGNKHVYIELDNSSVGDILYVDNVSAKEIEGWLTSDADLDLDDTNEKSGTYAAKITASADNGYVYQDLTVNPGSYYTFGIWHKEETGDSVKVFVGTSSDKTKYFQTGWISVSDYQEQLCTFKATESNLEIGVFAKRNGDIFYLDDAWLVPLVEMEASVKNWKWQVWPANKPYIY